MRPFDAEKARYWMAVDQYIGGVEHAVCIFFTRAFLPRRYATLGLVEVDEPFSNLLTQGMVCKETYRCVEHSWLFPGELIGSEKEGWKCPALRTRRGKRPGRKNVKSKKNIVDPEELINLYGADTARFVYAVCRAAGEGPESGAIRASRVLIVFSPACGDSFTKIVIIGRLVQPMARAVKFHRNGAICGARSTEPLREVSDDIDGRFHFNTAIAAIMELLNALSAAAQVRT